MLHLLEYLETNGVALETQHDPARSALRSVRHRASVGVHSPSPGVRAADIAFTPRGSDWTLSTGVDQRQARVRLPLIGDFNVSNALGAAAAVWARGWKIEDIAKRLGT